MVCSTSSLTCLVALISLILLPNGCPKMVLASVSSFAREIRSIEPAMAQFGEKTLPIIKNEEANNETNAKDNQKIGSIMTQTTESSSGSMRYGLQDDDKAGASGSKSQDRSEDSIIKITTNYNQNNAATTQKKPGKSISQNSLQGTPKKRLLDKQDRRNISRPKSRLVRTNNGQCEYVKGVWQACQQNGIQQRVLRLSKRINRLSSRTTKGKTIGANKNINNVTNVGTSSNNDTSQSVTCESVRIIRRDCNTGCKYLRGQWSAKCVNGQRLRIDTLIGSRWRHQNYHKNQINNHDTKNNTSRFISCQPERKVVKDCKHTCHYIKSDWSDCVNGFKRRTLLLDERPLEDFRLLLNSSNSQLISSHNKDSVGSKSGTDGARGTDKQISKTGVGCVKTKTVRRACRPAKQQAGSSIPVPQASITSSRPQATLAYNSVANDSDVERSRVPSDLDKQTKSTLIVAESSSSSTKSRLVRNLRQTGEKP